MIGHLGGLLYILVCWVFLFIVAGSIALHRWRARERHDAAQTAAVMASLAHVVVADHSKDILP